MELKIATRGSALALVQAGEVKEALERQGLSCVIKTVRTRGDADRRGRQKGAGRKPARLYRQLSAERH